MAASLETGSSVLVEKKFPNWRINNRHIKVRITDMLQSVKRRRIMMLQFVSAVWRGVSELHLCSPM